MEIPGSLLGNPDCDSDEAAENMADDKDRVDDDFGDVNLAKAHLITASAPLSSSKRPKVEDSHEADIFPPDPKRVRNRRIHDDDEPGRTHPFLATTPTPPSCDLDKRSLASDEQGRLQEDLARRNFKALELEGAPWRRNSPFAVILWREL